MNKFTKTTYKGKIRGGFSKTQAQHYAPVFKELKNVNSASQKPLFTSYMSTMEENNTSSFGRGQSVIQQTSNQGHFGKIPQLRYQSQSNRNIGVGSGNTFAVTDENAWSDDDFNTEDPLPVTQNRRFSQFNKRADVIMKPTPYQRNNGPINHQFSDDFYNYPNISNKRQPLMQMELPQNQVYSGYNNTTWGAQKNYDPYTMTNMIFDDPGYMTNMFDGPSYMTNSFGNTDSHVDRSNSINQQRIDDISQKSTIQKKESPEISTQAEINNFETKINEGNFPRMFTVSISKLVSWNKHNIPGEIIFEVFGILDAIKLDKRSGVQKFSLKGQQKGRIDGTFYELDRKLEIGHTGQWHRCVGLLKKNGEFQCLSLRSATQEELATLDTTLSSNSKALAHLFRQFSG